jgi:medium-chain acyl-[acyl-carrier-protein] hydrolase
MLSHNSEREAVAQKRRKRTFAPFRTVERVEMRLFCFPYAGGGTAIYHEWQACLPPGIEVCAARLPGREDRLDEVAFNRLVPLVKCIADDLSPLLDRPFMLFGHSAGAFVAFELARELRRRKEPMPLQLLVSAARAPRAVHWRPDMHALPRPDLIEALKQMQGIEPELLEDESVLDFILPIIRLDFSVLETYEYVNEPPLDRPIVAFAGAHDSDAPAHDMLLWREETTGPLSLHVIDGGHFFLRTARPDLLIRISSILERQLSPQARS